MKDFGATFSSDLTMQNANIATGLKLSLSNAFRKTY
jgi:hypothetical protein